MSSDPASRPALHGKHSEAFTSSGGPESDTPAPEAANTSSKLAYHPLSLIILVIWIAYISVLIWLLEHSTRLATSSYPPPEWSNRLTSAALTGFAQFHTAVTVMHLARLAVSVLYRDGRSAVSVVKQFWLIDRKWEGPISVCSTLFKKLTMWPNHRFSITFMLFAVTCLITVPAPYLLERGYEEQLIELTLETTVAANTFSIGALPVLNAWMQMSTGEGAWVTGLPITDIYNSSLFVPGTQARDDTAHDVVLAGSLVGLSAPALPGVRVESECNLYNGTMPGFYDTFSTWCQGVLPGMKYSDTSKFTAGKNDSIEARIAWCIDHDYNNTKWMSTSGTSPVTAYIRFNATDGAQQEAGMIKCTSTFSLGTARADGRYNNFSAFTDTSDSVDTQLQHPLFASLYDLTVPFTVSDNLTTFNGVGVQRVYSILAMLGYTPTATSGEYKQPTLDIVAGQLRRGTMCMGAAIGALAKRPDQIIHNALEYHAVSGRVRDPPYIWAGAALLIAWLLLIVYCTIRMFRRTLSSALDRYDASDAVAKVSVAPVVTELFKYQE